MKNQIIFFILIGLVFPACSPFMPQQRMDAQGKLPQNFTLYSPGNERPDKWWEAYDDPELNDLIDEALSGDFSLKAAWARLKQAEALALKTGAPLYPDFSLSAGAARARQGIDTGSINTTGTVSDYSLGLATSYELDVWGKIRSEREAAVLEVQATREDINTAAMTLTASVVEHWLNIISKRMQKQLLEKQIEINQTYLDLVELRFHKGMVSALDVYQQRQTIEKVRSQIPLIEAQEYRLMNELAILLGHPPGTDIRISRDRLPAVPQIPKMGLPSDLLASRPDIRAAGLRLQAADWQVSAARADRLPEIKLTGTASFASGEWDLLFDNWLLKLAGNLTAPILDGKRRAAEVERTLAKADESLWKYRSTVYTAVKEVENALMNEKKQSQHIQTLEKEMETAQNAFDQAVARYRKGLSDYLPVLTQLLSIQQLERDMIQRETENLVYRVNLYRALGGGTWMNALSSVKLHALKIKGTI